MVFLNQNFLKNADLTLTPKFHEKINKPQISASTYLLDEALICKLISSRSKILNLFALNNLLCERIREWTNRRGRAFSPQIKSSSSIQSPKLHNMLLLVVTKYFLPTLLLPWPNWVKLVSRIQFVELELY